MSVGVKSVANKARVDALCAARALSARRPSLQLADVRVLCPEAAGGCEVKRGVDDIAREIARHWMPVCSATHPTEAQWDYSRMRPVSTWINDYLQVEADGAGST